MCVCVCVLMVCVLRSRDIEEVIAKGDIDALLKRIPCEPVS